MLKKRQRVGSRLFETILKSGKTRHSPFFSLRVMVTPSEFTASGFHLAISVPKKVARKAVDRNRLRRRASAIVEKLQQRFESDWSAILFVKAPAVAASFKEFEKELIDFLTYSGILV